MLSHISTFLILPCLLVSGADVLVEEQLVCLTEAKAEHLGAALLFATATVQCTAIAANGELLGSVASETVAGDERGCYRIPVTSLPEADSVSCAIEAIHVPEGIQRQLGLELGLESGTICMRATSPLRWLVSLFVLHIPFTQR